MYLGQRVKMLRSREKRKEGRGEQRVSDLLGRRVSKKSQLPRDSRKCSDSMYSTYLKQRNGKRDLGSSLVLFNFGLVCVWIKRKVEVNGVGRTKREKLREE